MNVKNISSKISISIVGILGGGKFSLDNTCDQLR